jgi:hypothetical protein
VDHHYPLDGTVVFVFVLFDFASTLQIFSLVASPQCTNEDQVVEGCVNPTCLDILFRKRDLHSGSSWIG